MVWGGVVEAWDWVWWLIVGSGLACALSAMAVVQGFGCGLQCMQVISKARWASFAGPGYDGPGCSYCTWPCLCYDGMIIMSP
jgi:hypothetical protein